MSRNRLPALLILGILATTTAGFAALAVASGKGGTFLGDFSIPQALFMLVGAWILFAHPTNRIGWLFSITGLLSTTGQLAHSYSVYELVHSGSDPSPLIVTAAWYAEWYWMPWLFLFLSGAALLFPTGKPLSRRWGYVAWAIAFFAMLLTVLTALDPVLNVDSIDREAIPLMELSNPVGISPLGDPDDAPLVLLFLPVLFLSAIASATSLVLRFKRSRGDERQQMKWFVYGAVVMIGGFILFGGLDGFGYDVPDALEGALQTALPVTAAIAILRYRLYDIDVLVNRTLVYTGLSAILAGAYLGTVVLLQSVLAPFTADSDVAVAGSTLGVAALFRPVRGWVQSFIDRRFYRHKYDAAETLEEFATSLRDEVDLDSLTRELVGVVTTTMQPAHASLWLRAQGAEV
ncbi:MAG TPA: hypothetical protein VJ927_00435 [Actinomycetota bacterium]|nr:hypothetical protein [Actinomycetota bacterium]